MQSLRPKSAYHSLKQDEEQPPEMDDFQVNHVVQPEE